MPPKKRILVKKLIIFVMESSNSMNGKEHNNVVDSATNAAPINNNNGSTSNQVTLPSLSNLNNSIGSTNHIPHPHAPINTLVKNNDTNSKGTFVNETSLPGLPLSTFDNPISSTNAAATATTTNNVISSDDSTNKNTPVSNLTSLHSIHNMTNINEVPSIEQNSDTNKITSTGTTAQSDLQNKVDENDTSYRPLNVKDALSYLEQVKLQFNDRPHIYNRFLDIMKDFKSQTIDTPGVIDRVSNLFKGYPVLIQGFNTFLPHGYRIDCTNDPNDPIKVTTPMGATSINDTSTITASTSNNLNNLTTSAKAIPGNASDTTSTAATPIPSVVSSVPQPHAQLQNVEVQKTLPHTIPQPTTFSQYASTNQLNSNVLSNPNSTIGTPPTITAKSTATNTETSNVINNITDNAKPSSSNEEQKKPSEVEFSQAISYVNKIKNRFVDQPEVYKNFLEILQTYQREQKPISKVYAQVTVLFQNAPDLLEDFKKFLPDSSTTNTNLGMNETINSTQNPQQLQSIMNNNNNNTNQYGNSFNLPNNFDNRVHGSFNNVNNTNYYVTNNTSSNQKQNLPPIGSFSPPSNGSNPPLKEDKHKTTNSISQVINTNNTNIDKKPINLPSMLHHEQTIDISSQQSPQMTPGLNSHHHQQHPPHHFTNGKIQISNLRGDNSPMLNQYGSPLDALQLQQQQQMLHEANQYGIANNINNDNALLDENGGMPVRPEIDLDPSIVPVIPEPTEPIEDNLSLVEEADFFERVKKFINNKQIYTEFLKILNLFSQDLLPVNELVYKVENYIGSQVELFTWFKNFVGFQDKPKIIENIVHEKHKLDLDLCEAYGPSYKKLPKTDTYMPCSGRDAMCWEVLNDEWVGHPVWASEDSGFIAHRKNQYEETLFKIEEERHEYDYYIESNLRTIQTLETIANRISNMSDEEKKMFKLPPGLGHTSTTIYKKVIRKVYDKERGFEIIDALHEYPAIAIPVILKRLKQKDEEWRRAQREWNKVWREIEQKVYFKSLDHLGLTFKQADKKLLTTKQLVSEISGIKVDQNNKRMHWLTPTAKSQLNFQFEDFEILYDIVRLTDIFINHATTYSNPDKYRLKDLLRKLISLLFFIPTVEIENAVKQRTSPAELTKEKGENENDSTTGPGRKRVRTDVELSLSDILQRTKYQKLTNPPKEKDSSEEAEEEAEKLAKEAELIAQEESRKPWLLGNVVETANSSGLINDRDTYNIFANTNVYIFFRHLCTIYERLFECKQMNEKVTKEINSRRTTKFAEDLNLVSKQLKNMGLDFVGKDSYQELLNLSKRLIENDLEHQWFEESLRQAYNNKAFKMYTVDKITQSLVKHAHVLMTDKKTSEIMSLFEKDRLQPSTTTKDQILYRLQTRSNMTNSENMFRIEYSKSKRHASIEYIALDDLTIKGGLNKEDNWKYYLTSYALPHPTEGINQDKLMIPFLDRILDFENDALSNLEHPENSPYSPAGTSTSRLKINIDKNEYKLQIESGSFDVFSRNTLNKFPKKVNTKKYLEQKKVFDRFLNSKIGWKQGLTDAELNGLSGTKETEIKETEIKETPYVDISATSANVPSINQ